MSSAAAAKQPPQPPTDESGSDDGRSFRVERTDSFGDTTRFLLAVPKKGRLHTRAMAMLDGAGVQFFRPKRLDVAQCTSLPITLVFLPAKDIAKFVSEGKVDMGMTGEDIIQESRASVNLVMSLGFGKCRLCVQGPVAHKIGDVSELVGKRIVTSYTNITRDYFAKLPGGEATKVSYISGSVEAACALGLADGIVDLVETGTTMRAAGLEIISEVLHTQAVLISNHKTKHPGMVAKLHKRFEGYLAALKYNMLLYNIKETAVEQAKVITPGTTGPTIMDLKTPGWKAIQVMVLKTQTSDIMDRLADLGATGIVVLNITNCRI